MHDEKSGKESRKAWGSANLACLTIFCSEGRFARKGQDHGLNLSLSQLSHATFTQKWPVSAWLHQDCFAGCLQLWSVAQLL